MKFYVYDINRVFTGEVIEPEAKQVVPKRATHIAPPNGSGYQVFDGAKWFTRSEYPKRVTPTPSPTVTVGEFFDLFGDQKYPILSSDNLQVRALIQDVTVRDTINLNTPHLKDGLQMLVDAGFTIDVDRVLAGQMPPEEESP